LVSAEENFGVEKIWETAMEFRHQMSLDYIVARRIKQRRRAMWKYLGDAMMH
jgi:hypothetical protein